MKTGQLNFLKRAVVDNDPDDVDETVKYSSSKSPLDPSSMGFDDYLVNTYEVQNTVTQDSQVKNVPKISVTRTFGHEKDMPQSCSSNRITLEDHSDTNLLDETSLFKHNLPSRSSFDEQGRTEETQIAMQPPYNALKTPYLDHDFNNEQKEEQSSASFTPSPLFIPSMPEQTTDFRNSGQKVLQELARNSQNTTANQSSMMLQQASHIGLSVAIQNSSSLFKTPELVASSSSSNQQHSHFITFKPQKENSPIRNPFPQKFKHSPIKTANLKFEELSFNDNIKNENECYMVAIGGNSPKVFSQHSALSSAPLSPSDCGVESAIGGGGQLTLSQLCPAAPETNSTSMLRVRPTAMPVMYPTQLTELPSRIQEESQEFSYSNPTNLLQKNISGESSPDSNDGDHSNSLVNTQETLNQVQETAEEQAPMVVLAADGELVNGSALSRRPQERSAVQNQNEVVHHPRHHDRAYISDGGQKKMEPYRESFSEVNFREGNNKLSFAEGVQQVSDPRSLELLQKSHLDYTNDQLQAVFMQMSGGQQHQDHFSQIDLALMTSISSKGSEGQTQNERSRIPTQSSPEKSSRCEPSPQQHHLESSQQTQSESMKNHYEAQMRRLKQSRNKVVKQASASASFRGQKPATQSQKITKSAQPKPPVMAQAAPDAFYKKNVEWRQQIDEINMSKKNILHRHRLIKETKECTFKPQLKTTKFNQDLDRLCGLAAEAPQGGNPVEDRCLQWANQAKKKKQQVEQRLERFTECTFNPTLVSKQYKKRVCPNYDVKHKDRQIFDEIAQEYDYFTYGSDLNLADESKENLKKLQMIYKSNETGNLAAQTQDKGMTDLEKMIAINDFLERSEAWAEKVDQKKAKIAEELDYDRNYENTFHPRVDPVSELIHDKKMKLLLKVNQSAIVQKQQDPLSLMPLQMVGLAEKEARDNLFEYYLPKSKLVASKSQGRVSARASHHESNLPRQTSSSPVDAALLLQTSQQTTSQCEVNVENRPMQQATPLVKRSKEAKENKHPADKVDFAYESRKFSRLIEVLSSKLNEQPDLRAAFMPRQIPAASRANHKDEDKIPPTQVVTKEDTVLHLSLDKIKCTENVSFQVLNHPTTTLNIGDQQQDEYCDSIRQVLRESDSSNFFNPTKSNGKDSEETSHFDNGFTQTQPKMEPLDLSWLTKESHQQSVNQSLPILLDLPAEESCSTTLLNNHRQRSQIQQSSSTSMLTQENKLFEKDSSLIFVDLESQTESSCSNVVVQNNKTQGPSEEVSEMESISKEQSTSMRKHFDYIYKRKLGLTNRTSITSSITRTLREEGKIGSRSISRGSSSSTTRVARKSSQLNTREVKDIKVARRKRSPNQTVTTSLNTTLAPKSIDDHLSAVNLKTNTDASVAESTLGRTERGRGRGLRRSNSNTSQLFKKRNTTPSCYSNDGSSPGGLTERNSKVISGSNTARLFKKQRDQSGGSHDSNATGVTPRVFNNQDISNVIMQEHSSFPEILANADSEQLTARSVKADPQIVKLSEKLRGLKQRETLSVNEQF